MCNKLCFITEHGFCFIISLCNLDGVIHCSRFVNGSLKKEVIVGLEIKISIATKQTHEKASLTEFSQHAGKSFCTLVIQEGKDCLLHINDFLRHMWEPIFLSLFREKVSLSGFMFMEAEKPQQPVYICNGLSRCKIEMTLNISHTLI